MNFIRYFSGMGSVLIAVAVFMVKVTKQGLSLEANSYPFLRQQGISAVAG